MNTIQSIEFIDISSCSISIQNEVWTLYEESFPLYERRGYQSHNLAMKDSRFKTKVAIDSSGNFLALLFYWDFTSMIYVEHLAVVPTMRGSNIGSRIIHHFIEQCHNHKIILEIDPVVDEVSSRRLSFYKRLNFCENDYNYKHPSYSRNTMTHKLSLLSYPTAISDSEYTLFCSYINDIVLQYIDE